jgi:hypothetical protein
MSIIRSLLTLGLDVQGALDRAGQDRLGPRLPSPPGATCSHFVSPEVRR